jgi:hypothetical protein
MLGDLILIAMRSLSRLLPSRPLRFVLRSFMAENAVSDLTDVGGGQYNFHQFKDVLKILV